MKSKASAAIALVSLLAAGLFAALALAPAASAWSPTDLPPGWTVEHIQSIGATVCPVSYRIWTDGRKAWSNPFCTDSPTYQADFDAWVNAHYTPPPTTAPTTTADTATTTTTTAAATTDPATTSTDVTTTDAAAPAPAPQPSPPDTSATTTSATTTATTSCDVQCQIADLQSQIDALRGQLGQLVQILETWPGIDPGILSELMALKP